MEDAIDVVHRVERPVENHHRQIAILFSKRNVRDKVWKQTKSSWICKQEGIQFVEDLTQENWKATQTLWPRIRRARKDGNAAGFRGPFAFIKGKRI